MLRLMAAGVPLQPWHDWTPLDTIGGQAGILTVANELLVAIFFLTWICSGNGACKHHLLPRVFSPFSFL